MTPVTIFTGFLGSGKTTLIKKIIEENPQTKFGLIINEFGEVGIDGTILQVETGEEIVEMSNGCMCCIVRSDLQAAVKKMAQKEEIDYIIIETSGLAEPAPIAQTFLMDNLEGLIKFDGVVTVIDGKNWKSNKEKYQTFSDQIKFADILTVTKLPKKSEKDLLQIKEMAKELNPEAPIIENPSKIASILIEDQKWNISKFMERDAEASLSRHNNEEEEHHENEKSQEHQNHEEKHNHEHHHHHEHNNFDEILFETDKILDPIRLDTWMQTKFPKNVIRSKGILKLREGIEGVYLFQMVGANKQLDPIMVKDFEKQKSRLVLIGQNLDKKAILEDLKGCVR